jgi:predicted amidohydrolase
MVNLPFNSPYAHGFLRAAVATPRVGAADPGHNGRQVLGLARAAADDHASIVVFPALSGYSIETRSGRCRETYNIQVQGLTRRLEATALKRAVIGVSGGLDSAQALLVTARVFDLS